MNTYLGTSFFSEATFLPPPFRKLYTLHQGCHGTLISQQTGEQRFLEPACADATTLPVGLFYCPAQHGALNPQEGKSPFAHLSCLTLKIRRWREIDVV